MTAEVMMKEYKNMKKELTVTEFQLRQFQGVSEQDMIDSMLYSHQEGERVQTSTLSDKTANIAVKYKAAMERENDEWYGFLFHRYMFLKEEPNEYVYKFKTASIRLTSEWGVDWVLDGEYGGTRTEVNIGNLKERIRILLKK